MTGLERVTSLTNKNAEMRRRYREQRELEESLQYKLNRNEEKEGAVSSRYESLNYEIVENKLYQAEEMEPGHQVCFHFSDENIYPSSTCVFRCTDFCDIGKLRILGSTRLTRNIIFAAILLVFYRKVFLCEVVINYLITFVNLTKLTNQRLKENSSHVFSGNFFDSQ